MAVKDKIQIPEVVMPTGNFEKALDRLNERIDETGQTFSNMAERIEKDAAVKIKHSVDSIVKSIDKMASGNNMAKYWKSQNNLIEDLTKTYDKLNRSTDSIERRDLSQELYKTFNALKAVSGANFSNLQELEIIKKASEWIDKAKYWDSFKMEFSPTAFREMFDVFEQMEESGANVQRVFKTISKGVQFDDVSRELKNVREQLENVNSTDLNEIQDKLERLSSRASDEFRTFLNSHGINENQYQASEYFERIEKGAITSQEAIKDFKYFYDYLLESGHQTSVSGSEIFNTTEMRQMTEMIAEISFRVSELYSNVNTNSDRQIIEPTELKQLSDIFDTLNNHLQEIRKSLGSVDDDLEINTILSSVTKLNDTFTEVANTLDRISKSNFSSNFSMTFGSNSETDKQVESYLETTLQQLQERYKRFYEKSAKYGLDDPLMGIYGSVSSLPSTYSSTEFENMFSPQAISGITDVTDRIRRLIEFMNILRQAIDANRGSGDFWKDLSKSQIASSNQLYNMNTVTKNVNKIRNTVAEGNPLGDIFKTDLTPLVNEIQMVITKLDEMMSIFRSNESGNGIVDFANQSIQAINRLTEAFERFSSESKEALNGLNVNVVGTSVSQETSATSIEKVKENLKEIEVQAEKTEQAIKEVTNVSLNESTLSNSNQIVPSDTSGIERINGEIVDVIDANEKLADSARASAQWIEEEGNSAGISADKMIELYKAKKEAVEANLKLRKSADNTAKALTDKGNAAENAGKKVSNMTEIEKLQNKANNKLSSFQIKYGHLEEFGEYYDQIDRIKNDIKSISSEADLSKIIVQIDEMATEFKDIQVPKDLTEAKWGNKFYKWLNENTKAVGQFGNRIEELKKQYESIETQGQLDQFGIDFTRFTRDVEKARKTGLSFFDGLIKRAKSMSQSFLGMYLSLYDIVRYIRQISSTVIELDTAMTELKKVSSATLSEVENSFDDMAESAKEYGSTVTDMINATADWSRMGYGLEDSQVLAEVSVLYKNVGDGIDIDTANESLVSTLQGFQMDASEAIEIVDKFNEVAKNWRNMQ